MIIILVATATIELVRPQEPSTTRPDVGQKVLPQLLLVVLVIRLMVRTGLDPRRRVSRGSGRSGSTSIQSISSSIRLATLSFSVHDFRASSYGNVSMSVLW